MLGSIGRTLRTPATLVVLLAFVVAGTGTATAAKLLTGKNVRDGSLGVKDLSKKARKSLKGAKGATGERGSAGQAGAQGAQGPAGPQGLQGATGLQGPAGIVAPLFGEDASENIGNGADVLLLTVPVPSAGTYVINAKTNLFAVQAATFVDCRVEAGGLDVDFVQWTAGAVNSRQSVSMQAVAAATPAGPPRVRCAYDDGNGTASETKLTAIPVS
jgi:hypothetical protein